MKRAVIVSLCAFVAWIGACSRDAGKSSSPGIEVAVAPLEEPGIGRACYGITIFNELPDATNPDFPLPGPWAAVTTASGICSDQYGNGVGDITYVAVCDADAETTSDHNNTVQLVLESLWDTNGTELIAGADFHNPCPPVAPGQDNGCVLTAPCSANSDTRVVFDLTVLRQASLGFFDVAVRFKNIFCAAKLDCEDDAGDPLLYLADPSGDPPDYDETAVLAFACLTASGAETFLYLSDLDIICESEFGITRQATVDPSAGPGNLSSWFESDTGNPVLFGASVTANGMFEGGKFWNVMLGINTPAATDENCTLHAMGTVSSGPLEPSADGWLTDGSVYPYVVWDVPLFDETGRICSQHPLNEPGSGVTTAYTAIGEQQSFAHELQLATGCPCWSADTLTALAAQYQSIIATGTRGFDWFFDGEFESTAVEMEVEFAAEAAAGTLGINMGLEWGEGEGACAYIIVEDGVATEVYRPVYTSIQADACALDIRTLLQDPCLTANGGCAEVCHYTGPDADGTPTSACYDACLADDTCATASLLCIEGMLCAECAYDELGCCTSGTDCNYDSTPGATPTCDFQTFTCVQCTQDFHCENVADLPACLYTGPGTGSCVECTNDDDCPGSTCDIGTFTCVTTLP